MVGTTDNFSNMIDPIYNMLIENASNITNNIYNELTEEGTPRTNGRGSPIDTGALRANWNVGTVLFPNYIDAPDDYANIPFINKSLKTYGRNDDYYVWNNTPYLRKVNAGFTDKGRTKNSIKNMKFIEKAIARAESKYK